MLNLHFTFTRFWRFYLSHFLSVCLCFVFRLGDFHETGPWPTNMGHGNMNQFHISVISEHSTVAQVSSEFRAYGISRILPADRPLDWIDKRKLGRVWGRSVHITSASVGALLSECVVKLKNLSIWSLYG